MRTSHNSGYTKLLAQRSHYPRTLCKIIFENLTLLILKMNTELALNTIKNNLKEKIVDIKIYGETWGNLVLEINNKWIFRFPKFKESRSLLEKEIIFLSKFSSKSPISIPSLIAYDDSFIWYEKIKGIPLNSKVFKTLTQIEKNNIAKDLAKFLSWLHSINFKNQKIPILNDLTKKIIFEKISTISKELSSDAQKNILKYFNSIDYYVINNNKKTLIHNDLGEGNIIINNGRVSGIIDFGRLMYGYPELDFAKLWRNFGKDFAKQVLDLCLYDKDKFEILSNYDLINREKPFINKLEENFGIQKS